MTRKPCLRERGIVFGRCVKTWDSTRHMWCLAIKSELIVVPANFITSSVLVGFEAKAWEEAKSWAWPAPWIGPESCNADDLSDFWISKAFKFGMTSDSWKSGGGLEASDTVCRAAELLSARSFSPRWSKRRRRLCVAVKVRGSSVRLARIPKIRAKNQDSVFIRLIKVQDRTRNTSLPYGGLRIWRGEWIKVIIIKPGMRDEGRVRRPMFDLWHKRGEDIGQSI